MTQIEWNRDDLFERGRDAYLEACARVGITSIINPVYKRTVWYLKDGQITLHSNSRPLWEGTFDETGRLINETLF